jgi:large subunit ribosomal protein L19
MNNERLQELYTQKGYKRLNIEVGQYLELHERLGDRIWRFKGLVIKLQKPSHPDGTFTIRGVTAGHTIEKVYPLSFPTFEKVTVLDEYKIRRSKLYYIRDKVGKAAKFKSVMKQENKDRNLLATAA